MDQSQLVALANGQSICKSTPAQAVIIQQQTEAECVVAEQTVSVVLDADKLMASECPKPSFDLTNGTGADVELRFGGTGVAGFYQLANEAPQGVDFAGLISNEYGAAGSNAMRLQLFNFFVRTTGVLVTRFEVRNLSANQVNQRLAYKSYKFDIESSCKSSTIAPACSPCFNTSTDGNDQVRQFDGNWIIDDMHYLSYILKAGESVVIDLTLGAQASARNYVACNG